MPINEKINFGTSESRFPRDLKRPFDAVVDIYVVIHQFIRVAAISEVKDSLEDQPLIQCEGSHSIFHETKADTRDEIVCD